MDEAVERLDELLERERELLRAGDLGPLADLAEHKQRLMAAIPASDSADLDRLRAAVARNGRLLAAAAQGVKDAGNRLRQLTAGPDLVTYDGKGRRQQINPAKPSVSRNA
jgi:flagellar biosynthesis/type III secretory pathway chaperone